MSESAEEGRARRAAAVARIRGEHGIDEALIRRLVDAFYERVRADPVLAPVFAARITDWAPHLDRMYRFWRSVLLYSAEYHGSPMDKHRSLPIDAGHFEHWLALFERTARETCPQAAAGLIVARAQRMRRSLEAAVAEARDASPGPAPAP